MVAVRELRRRVRDDGFVGLRLLPWLWGAPPTDRRYYPLFAECVELGVPFCTQVGHTGPLRPSETGRPIPYIDEIALDFPELVIVCGHIGYPWTEEMIAVARKHENVYIDTSAYTTKRLPGTGGVHEDRHRRTKSVVRQQLSDDLALPRPGRAGPTAAIRRHPVELSARQCRAGLSHAAESIRMNGAQALITTLVDNGVRVCFANPGTSEMHFVAALDTVPEMRGVLTLFEGVATGAADGYARMSGDPAAVLLHLGPGLGNGLANLHNARRAVVPMLVVVGDHATYHKKYDAPLESDIDSVAGTVSGWVRRTGAVADVAADTAEAIASARAARHISTLILPADVSWGEGAQLAERALAAGKEPRKPRRGGGGADARASRR